MATEISGAMARGDGREDAGAPVLPLDLTRLLYGLVVGLVAYIPVEEFVLKWLPVSDQVYSLARLGSEAVVYALLVVVVLGRLARGRFLRRTPVDLPLLVFLGLALASVFLNHAGIVPSLISLRTLLRYVALFYVVANLPLDERRVRLILLVILAMAAFESAVAALQFVQGGPTPFWYPRATALELGEAGRNFSILTSGVELGAVIGTLGHTVDLALFLLVAVTVVTGLLFTQGDRVQTVVPSWVLFAALGAFVAAILLTYSRASFLAALVGLGVVAWWRRHRRQLLRPLLGLGLAAIVLGAALSYAGTTGDVKLKQVHVNPLANIGMAFGSSTLEGRFSNTRLWLITSVGGSVLRSMTPLGYSPDEATARRRIAQNARGALDRILTYGPFEDVYWVALLSYYGLLGLGAFCWILVRLYRSAREVMSYTPGLWTRTAATSLASLLVLLIPLTFLVRTFEFRSLSLYLWLLGGVTLNRLDAVRSWRQALAGPEPDAAGEGPPEAPAPAGPS